MSTSTNPAPHPVVFVTADYTLRSPGGGVQRCTHEYLSVVRAAGFDVSVSAYAIDRRPLTRIQRLLFRRPYRNLIPDHFHREVAQAVQSTGARWVLFNQTESAPLVRPLAHLKQRGVRFALLSHGADSSDFLHNVRIRGGASAAGASSNEAMWLGRQLFAEMEHHRQFDLVFCLSETDRQLAQWLGAPVVRVLPRVVENTPLPWRPVSGRIGIVATLDHGPNIEGIELLCATLARAPGHIRLRVIGRPPETGRRLAERFPFVDYLGPLSDADLEAEACTWCAFANPIFCYPRGCSTKLAVPLSWRLPIVTSRAGARGYAWDETLVPLFDTPDAMAVEARRVADPATARTLRDQVAVLSSRCPTTATLADTVRRALE